MSRVRAPRLVAALLIAGLAIPHAVAAPPGADATCACCASGRCLLTDEGCDHPQPSGQGRLAGCCITASDRPGTATTEVPPRLEPAVLLARLDRWAIRVRRLGHPTVPSSDSPTLIPELPPPRPTVLAAEA